MSNEPQNHSNDDLNVDAEALKAPGAGSLGGDAGEQAQDGVQGPITFGTTCWGTPCPSANTISC
ncbi:MAG: hypothetical protein ACRD0H_20125 [Actinomycetes bacterium]